MKRKFEKLLSLILAMAMCLSLIQVTAFAYDKTGDGKTQATAITPDAVDSTNHKHDWTFKGIAWDGAKYTITYECKVAAEAETFEVKGEATELKLAKDTKAYCQEDGKVVYSVWVDKSGKAVELTNEASIPEALKTKHVYEDVVVKNNPATCKTTGTTKVNQVCKNCGAVVEGEEKTVEKLAHTAGKTVYGTLTNVKVTRADGKTEVEAGKEVESGDVVTLIDAKLDGSYVTETYCANEGDTDNAFETKTNKVDATETSNATTVVFGKVENVTLTAPTKGADGKVTKGAAVAKDTTFNANDSLYLIDDTKAGTYELVTMKDGKVQARETKTIEAGHKYGTASVSSLKNVKAVTKDGKTTYVSTSCKDDGSYVETTTCAYCLKDEKKTVTVKASGEHTLAPANVIVDTKPTCTTEGTAHWGQKCTICGVDVAVDVSKLTKAEQDEIAGKIKAATKKTAHTYEYEMSDMKNCELKNGKVVPTSCDEDGSYKLTEKCSVCGALKEGSAVKTVKVGKKAHTYAGKKYELVWGENDKKEQTSELKLNKVCDACGKGIYTTDSIVIADVTALSYAAKTNTATVSGVTVTKVTTKATCGKNEFNTYTATATLNNNVVAETAVSYVQTLKGGDKDATGKHTYGVPAKVVVKEATETEEGVYELVKTCTVCGDKVVVDTGIIAKLEKEEEPTEPEHKHAYGEAVKVVIKEATETETGVYELVKTCECGDKVVVATGTIAMLQKAEEPAPAKTSIEGAVVKQTKTVKYNGKLQNIPFTVTVDGKVLTANVDYTVATKASGAQGAQFTGVGNHDVVIKGIGEYEGNLTATLKIAKASQTIKVTPVSKTLKVNKKTAQKVALKTTGAKTAVTYTSNNKKVTVSKAGVVTVAKGFKGTAKITVKAGSNKNYNASNTVTVTIKVK